MSFPPTKRRRCMVPRPVEKGLSQLDFFTAKQVRDHILSLRRTQSVQACISPLNFTLSKSMPTKLLKIVSENKVEEETEATNKNCCQLCLLDKLVLQNVLVYCTPCAAPIKNHTKYYVLEGEGQNHAFCDNCFQAITEEVIEIDNRRVPKSQLRMEIFHEEVEEKWIQCSKCHARQHHICALLNELKSNEALSVYTCPMCYKRELKSGDRKPLPESAMKGAKDLPRTRLSDFIENRLFNRLRIERQQRADSLGKKLEDVPAAEGLVLRVVSSVDMELNVKPIFSEFFKEEEYPTCLPYKSKALALFQKIDGVEVLLFTMFVQEFGAECEFFPNQRSVYIAYIDSVKYFKPDVKTTDGEALRTFVYHEILIGYLEWCKQRGFVCCFIWSCPPRKGIDYIFHCHPDLQRTPKPNRLREWYLSMLKKGMKEDIVVGLTNLYDHFFTQQGESRAKVTGSRVPYFEGDYWPWAAETVIDQLLDEDKDLYQHNDAKLMQKMGETIYPKKDDFIMVHLHHTCDHCGNINVSGPRWACNSCQGFNICDWCHTFEKDFNLEKHPINSKGKHTLSPVEIGVPADTKDEDVIMVRGIFNNVSAFHSLCQESHYQFDTLRRAKHSSMMVLHHLHFSR
ncbi:hypothetical protein LUZ61_012793 [Rhynchospora tenuis]|uniref:histone acetyltransferase n=1 Tax=Rhynchospora tenuis TaxID=198213 RepID=A0AAD6A404_9POAL|nr:hypothetical protein LUZ61_012793 [Rhynchospora tenuis]